MSGLSDQKMSSPTGCQNMYTHIEMMKNHMKCLLFLWTTVSCIAKILEYTSEEEIRCVFDDI